MKSAFTNRMKSLTILAILISIGAGMLLLSWLKWPDLLIDFGMELYLPWFMNQGEIFYKDILTFVPLSVCVNAFLFKVSGINMMSIVWFNIILIVILTLIIYKFFLLTTDQITAATTSAVFLSMFAFAQYIDIGNYNFVCPYTHQMTHGIFLSFLTLYLFAVYLIKKKAYLFFIVACLTGFVFLTKHEVFLALFAALLLCMTLMFFVYRLRWKSMLRILLIFIAGFLLPIIGFLIYLSFCTNFFTAQSTILNPYTILLSSKITSNDFYRSVMGTDHLITNLYQMFIAAFYYLALLTCLWLGGSGLRYIKDEKLRIIFIFTLFALVYVSAKSLAGQIPWVKIFRGLPLAMIALEIYLLVSLLRGNGSEEKRSRLLSLLAMTGFGLLLLSKMALNVHIFHYGFALALPSTLLLCMVFVYCAPAFFEKSSEGKFIVRALGIVLIGFIIVFFVSTSKRLYEAKDFPVSSGPDTIITYNAARSIQGPCVKIALKEIERIIKKDENFLVLPEGVMLNYLARRKNPYFHINITPFQLDTVGEDVLLESLKKARPDYILLVDKDTSEFGYKYFGKDYGVKIYTWIKSHYTPVYLIGNRPLSGDGFGILISKRN